MEYNSLSDLQIENMIKLLDFAGINEMNVLFEDHKNIKREQSKEQSRVNILHGLMTNEIKVAYFAEWITKVRLHHANTIFHFQLNLNKTLDKKKLASKLKKNIVSIIDVNENLEKLSLININTNYKNQILFSFIMPAITETKKLDGTTKSTKCLYFAYVWLDYKNNSLIFSIPNYPHIHFINNKIIKKNQQSQLVNDILNYFRDNKISFEFLSSDWIVDVLNTISNEYFDHNNPAITSTLEVIEASGELTKFTKELCKLHPYLNNDLSVKRIERYFNNALENELINSLGPVKKETSFEVFLHEVSRGGAEYKANNRKMAFSFEESRLIISIMLDHGDINALGITRKFEDVEYKFKVYKGQNFFSLRRLTNGQTNKEVVEDVLTTFIKYRENKLSRTSTTSKSRVAKST